MTIPAGAMGLTEGIRASYIDRIKNGKTKDFWYLGGTLDALAATGKGLTIGGATGGAGSVAGNAAVRVGAGVVGKTAATAGAEVLTMPTTAAAMKRRFPRPQEFIDAAIFIGTLRTSIHGIQTASVQSAQLVPKLRDLYVKIGRTPQEIMEAAQKDPTVVEDIFAVNRDIPRAFATEILERLKAGEEVPTEELLPYKEQSWAQAVLNGRHGNPPQQIKTLAESVLVNPKSGERLSWGFVNQEEAARLHLSTKMNIQSGYSHTIDASAVKHTCIMATQPLKVPADRSP